MLDFNYISNQPASECVAATPLGAGYFPDIEFDTTGASGDDPCAPGIPTVWYKHYRDGGRIKGYLSTEGSSFDTHITVYETDGDCPVTCDDVVAANNRAYDGFGSRVWVEMKSGKTYYFAIRGATAEDFGQGRVVFRTAILNQVDACDRRPDVVGVTGVFMYTKESPFFRHCSGEFSSTQWMRYRARVPGTVTLRACDSSFPVYVSVFEGEGCDTSCDNVVTHGAIDCAEDEMISFRVEPDIWYMIAVGGVESGDYWKPDDSIGRVYATLLPDAGDDCSDLGGIQSGIRNISLPFDTAGASSNSPCAGENHPTVWYSYDPFRQGLLILTVSDADFTPFGEVYETAQCPSDCDTLVASGVVGSDLSSALTALSPDFSTGRFRIAIRGASPGEAGQGVLNLRFFEGEQAGNFTNNNDGILKVADVTQFAELLAAGIEVPDFMGDINDDQVVDWADVQALAEMIVE